jgi:hypothetical protein
MLHCVRKEGKVFFAYDSKVLISSTPKHLYMDGKVRLYYRVRLRLHHTLYKLLQKYFELLLQIIQASILSLELRSSTLQLQLQLGQSARRYYKLNSKIQRKR